MCKKVSKITDAERKRRAALAEMDTAQSLAGLLYVAECVAQGATVSSWTYPNGKTMDLPDRYAEIKASILEMQRKECADEPLESS